MLGLKLKVPPAEFAAAAREREAARHSRRRQCRAPAAAARRHRRRDRRRRAPARRACAARRESAARGGAAGMSHERACQTEPRHFLDLLELSPHGTARHSRRRRGDEGGARQGREAPRAPARRQDAGDDLRPALDAHARLVRCRHARTRRRDDHADRRGDAARPRRDDRRHGARAVALRRRDHDPHPRATTTCANSRATPPCP